nr:hypothetical protein [Tanacetum cinerariifolium]
MTRHGSQRHQGNPLHLLPNDSNCASIVNIKLTGVENYRVWGSAVKLALQIKNKIGFLTGSCLRSDYVASRPLLEQWDMCNVVVFNWILSSLSQDVCLGHVFSDNVACVWNELKETYDRIDGSIVFNMLQKINSFKQRGLLVSEYCHKLNSLWREFDILTKFPNCTCEESHGRIPASYVKIENASSVKSEKPQVVAFVSRFNDNNNKKRNTGSWSNRNNGTFGNKGNYDSLLCKNCGLKGHTVDSPVSLRNEQMLRLMSLLNDKSSTTANANMADIERFKKGKVLGTGSEFVGLYLFNKKYNVSSTPSKNVWGPYKVVSREGFRYFLTIADDYSRSVWVYMLKTKDEVF